LSIENGVIWAFVAPALAVLVVCITRCSFNLALKYVANTNHDTVVVDIVLFPMVDILSTPKF